MKNFLRSITGKTVVFIACIASICVLAASIMLAAFMAEFNFYTYGKSDILKVAARDGNPDFLYKMVDMTYDLRYAVYVIILLALILSIASFVCLMSVSGHRPADEMIYPGPLNRMPFDIMAALYIALLVIYAVIIENINYADAFTMIVGLGGSLVMLNLLIGLCMSLAVRIKKRDLIKSTVIYKLLVLFWRFVKILGGTALGFLRLCRDGISKIPMIWKTAVSAIAICLIDLIGFSFFRWNSEGILGFWFVKSLILMPLILWIAWSLRKLQIGAHLMAEGNLEYHIPTHRMFGDIRRSAEDLNNIAGGMAVAVEDRLKSERFKTELITNVSHDIKTPLTSVINYASLISEELGKETPDEGDEAEERIVNVKDYSEVLVRQSERLKTLIDDLVEASKAQTGNLDVYPAPCNAATFIEQIAGEYADQLKKSKLTLVTKVSDEDMTIMADSRRMQRIFDNLMSNICKYAQHGTRVYLSLEQDGGNAVMTFKNTSKEELDISEDELMERFVRGDKSRNTDGNGLGLSIAKSFAELQGGDLSLSTDGDLFKATLTFPAI